MLLNGSAGFRSGSGTLMHALPLNAGTLPPEGVGAGVKLPERLMRCCGSAERLAGKSEHCGSAAEEAGTRALFLAALWSGWLWAEASQTGVAAAVPRGTRAWEDTLLSARVDCPMC